MYRLLFLLLFAGCTSTTTTQRVETPRARLHGTAVLIAHAAMEAQAKCLNLSDQMLASPESADDGIRLRQRCNGAVDRLRSRILVVYDMLSTGDDVRDAACRAEEAATELIETGQKSRTISDALEEARWASQWCQRP